MASLDCVKRLAGSKHGSAQAAESCWRAFPWRNGLPRRKNNHSSYPRFESYHPRSRCPPLWMLLPINTLSQPAAGQSQRARTSVAASTGALPVAMFTRIEDVLQRTVVRHCLENSLVVRASAPLQPLSESGSSLTILTTTTLAPNNTLGYL